MRWLQAGAVAAGVGVALMNGQGIAVASTDGDADSSAASDSGAVSTSNPDTSTSAPDHTVSSPSTDTGTTTAAEADSKTDDTADTVSVGGSPAVAITAQTNTGSTDKTDTPETTTETIEGDGGTSSTTVEKHNRADQRTTLAVPARDTEDVGASPHRSTAPTAAPRDVDIDSTPTASMRAATVVAEAAAPNPPRQAPVATVAVTAVDPPQTSPWQPVHQLVLGALSLLGFNPSPATGDPAPNPLLAAIWGVYREIESTFDNQRPTIVGASVTDSSVTGDGRVVVTGTLTATDPDGDSQTYSATNGAHGTVTVAADGTFTYTPTDPSYTGTDTFTITTADQGFHLHGLLGLFSADGGHTRTATVTVTLAAAAVNGAPSIDAVTSDPGSGNSWTLNVATSDPDDDPVTVTVNAVDAQHVTVTALDGEPTKYTVTVTDADWALANPGKQLVVDVTATDGQDTTSTTVTIGTVNNAIASGLLYGGYFGVPVPVPALPAGVTYAQVGVGVDHTVLLRTDGTAVVLGIDGQVDIPALPEGVTYTEVASGLYHSVLLRSDGSAITVGAYANGDTVIPLTPPSGVTYTRVAAGDFHTVLLRSDGTAVAVGTSGQTTTPTLPPGVYTAIYAGKDNTALLRSDGTMVIVGSNDHGQANVPAPPAGVTYTHATLGTYYTVLLRSDGNAVGFGDTPAIPDLPEGVVYSFVTINADDNQMILLRSDGVVVGATQPPAGVVYTQIASTSGNTVLLTKVDAEAPVAGNDTAATVEGQPVSIAANTLLANDSDADGDPLTVTAVWGAQHGTTALAADGTVTYTPEVGYSGQDTFTYLASDGHLGDAGSVTVTVAAAERGAVIGPVTPRLIGKNSWALDFRVTLTDPTITQYSVTVVPTDRDHVGVGFDSGSNFVVTVTDDDWAQANTGEPVVATVVVEVWRGEVPGPSPVTRTVTVGAVGDVRLDV